MKIALIISGRAARYDVCLIPILEAAPYEVDLYMSINDETCPYYEFMKQKLSKWLKGIYIEKFKIPCGFVNHYIPGSCRYYQFVDGKWVPRNQLSMYWNDKNAFSMATAYADTHGFEYDAYMRFRTDLFNTQLPVLAPIDKDELKLYSIYPLCMFTSYGIHKREIISSDWVWGNRKTMAVYCSTYDYVLDVNETMEGQYIFHFESNHTDNIVSSGVSIDYVRILYHTDLNRKIFDIDFDKLDTRSHEMPNKLPHIDIRTLSTTENIQPIPQIIL
jgi:hypothetical protein